MAPPVKKSETARDFYAEMLGDLASAWKQSKVFRGAVCFLMIPLFPFLLEAGLLGLALGILLPVALLYRLIEHHATPLWFVLVLIINVGGTADLVADVGIAIQLFKILILKKTDDINNEELTEDERNLIISRLVITLLAAVPVVVFWTLIASIPDKPGTKPSSNSSTAGFGNPLGLIVILVLWKAGLLILRFGMICAIIYQLIKYKKLRENFMNTLSVLESILLWDLLWSGLPLGFLTIVQLSYEELEFDGKRIWELIKLSALFVDCVGACVLIYFNILGLGKRHGRGEQHSEETTRLIDDTPKAEGA
eukprot:TRINITY_DN12909_c0_g1_i1.p1 TRINITY_DN12909_c0_g1~~TRINITY_DN12909_c0_g1_i1.p1  ORF type:complete len:308 (+),score=31.49 TRINITY_DN12909_c0_g1_i1:42-965(+)